MKFSYIILLTIAIGMIGCKSDSTGGMQTTASGFDYQVIHDASGPSANNEDWVTFGIDVVGDNGKVLQELQGGPNVPSLQILPDDQLPKANPVVDVLRSASLGDTIEIFMPVDSLGGPNPMLEGMQTISYIINVQKIQNDTDRKAEVEAQRLEAEALAEELKGREKSVADMVKKTLADYKAGRVKAEPKDGLEIIIHEEGTGAVAEAGKRAAMQYYGVLKSTGAVFDNSFKRGRPFTFTLGRGEVIEGWDKGIPGLKVGTKATLIIPYTMAYGEADRPTIPSKSDLVFYIEVEDVN